MRVTERINFIHEEFMRKVLSSALFHLLVLHYEEGGNTFLRNVGSNHQQRSINSRTTRWGSGLCIRENFKSNTQWI